MNPRRLAIKTLQASALLLTFALLTACGGGGGGGGGGGIVIPPGLAATFVPDNPTPGPNTLSLAAGPSSAADFDVELRVNGIDNFYGAAFRVYYDPATAMFLGMATPSPPTSTAESFIHGFGFGLDFRAVELSPGVISVTATRQGLIGGVTPASGVPDLLVALSFRATTNTTGNTFSLAAPAPAAAGDFREVQTCVNATDPCTIVPDGSLTWPGGTLVTN